LAKSKCRGIVWTLDERLNMCLAKDCCKAAMDDRSTPDFNLCQSGRMKDFFACGGGFEDENVKTCAHKLLPAPPPPTPGAYIEPITTSSPEPLCPMGQFCLWGPFGFGFCCDQKNEEVWLREYAAVCPSKTRVVNITQKDVVGEILRGKSCQDTFCPQGSKCVQGRYIAHCCV
ncbi:hypothetical protein PMAYCL1PPCAC_31911, partial [Pristionchus mayeri]